MRIAMPYRSGSIDPHFGKAEAFQIFFVENGAIVRNVILPTGGTGGHEQAVRFLKSAGVQLVICGGIGGAAIKALDDAGIMVMGGITGSCEDRIREFNEGKLKYVPAEAAVPHCPHHSGAHAAECAEEGCPDASDCEFHQNH